MANLEHDWFKMYPLHWLGDSLLRLCSPAARGTLIDLMCLAQDGKPVGYVNASGIPLSDPEIAQILNIPYDEFRVHIRELLDRKRIYHDDRRGYWIKRSVEDHERYLIQRAAGIKGYETKSAKKPRNPTKNEQYGAQEQPKGKSGVKARLPDSEAFYAALPDKLQTPMVKLWVQDWVQVLIAKKHRWTDRAMNMQVNKIKSLDERGAVRWLARATEGNWKGLFEPAKDWKLGDEVVADDKSAVFIRERDRIADHLQTLLEEGDTTSYTGALKKYRQIVGMINGQSPVEAAIKIVKKKVKK